MNAKILAVLLLIAAQFRLCQSKRYDGFSLYSVVVRNSDHLKFLQNLNANKYIDIVFWKQPFKLYEKVQFLVNPSDKDVFSERAYHFNMSVDLQIDDIQTAFDQQDIQRALDKDNKYNWNSYHTLQDIYTWLYELESKYPDTVQLESIGRSIMGKNIYALGIKRNEPAKGTVIVEAGIHGNEWITTEFVTYLANQLVHAKNVSVNTLSPLFFYHWYLVPVVNPDGYEYSQQEDRLWRKNIRDERARYGVDLNRNFDSSFGKHDSSNNPEDANYCGSEPFSEPESKALADFIAKHSQNLQFYFAIHSYGQKLIIPYSDRIAHLDNYGEMENFGKQAILKMFKTNGVKYRLGTTYDTLGMRISGTTTSWVKKYLNIRYVYTFVLRDNGTYGYALPSSQILPTCEEALAGLVELMTARPKRLRAYPNLFEFSNQDCPRLDRILIYLLCLFLIKCIN